MAQIDLSDPKALEVIDNNTLTFIPVVAIWDSGVGPYPVVARTRGGGIYLFDTGGSSADPLVVLREEIAREWAPAAGYLPIVQVSTNSVNRLVFTLKWPEGDTEILRAVARPQLTASLSDRFMAYKGRV